MSTGQTGQRVTFTFTILYMIADDARLTPPCCKKHMGSTGRWVNRSTGQRVKRVNGSMGHFHFHYIIYDSRRCQAHATPLQKSTRRMITPGSRHTTAKSTQHFLLTRRVNVLVIVKGTKDTQPYFVNQCFEAGSMFS